MTNPGPQRRFSVVTAVYNVHRYLPDFITSIEKQTFPLDQLEVIMVDDGSTDDSLVLLKEWAARRPELVTVLAKENGGQGSARNFGLDHVNGEWITFPDPDDILEPDYFQVVDDFLRANPKTAMIATNRIFLMEETGKIQDTHPLRRMFGKDELVDIDLYPDFSHGSAPAAFLRADVIAREQLRFDPRIRPNFEDGHFCARYMLSFDKRLIGFLKSARYLYRKRADGSSTLQTSVANPARYLAVPRYGYLDILRRGGHASGSAPEWLQNVVLYELSYYFSADISASGAITGAVGDVAVEFLKTLREIATLLDPGFIDAFAMRRFDRPWRDILKNGLTGQPWCSPYVVLDQRDVGKNEVKVVYRYIGDAPKETILFRGQVFTPQHAKVRDHEYFEHVLIRERIVWVPSNGALRVLLDGKPMPVFGEWPPPANTVVRPSKLDAMFDPVLRKRKFRLTPTDYLIRPLARFPLVRWRYRRAWVLMDRLHDADDSGERLFHYIQKNHREIRSYFVLERGTPDWKRMRRSRARRMVPYGSLRWRLLLLNCANVISSHVDVPVHRPPRIVRMHEPDWNFVFLQHGVIKDDLSRWLNSKKIDLFVTSTPQEQASIAADGPYIVTSREAKMTGLARFDRLRELGMQVPPDDRHMILVCPTWRHWLNPPLLEGSQRRSVRDDFLETEFAQMWLGFLTDDRMRALAEQHDLRIGFLPHPNIQPALELLTLPPHVEALTFAGQDVQRLIANSALMVTDYSSMAFNEAYIDRPTVYFHFDDDRVLFGGHVGRQGYFDYQRDGFGPVTRTIDELVDAVTAIVNTPGRAVAAKYQERIEQTFTERDGKCCERLVVAISDLSLPQRQPSFAEARRLVRAAFRRVRERLRKA